MVYNCKILRTKCVLAGGGSYRQNGRKSKKKFIWKTGNVKLGKEVYVHLSHLHWRRHV